MNGIPVDSIREVLSKLKTIIKYTPKDDAAKVEENKKIINIAEMILEFYNKILSGKGLKVPTPNTNY